VGLLGVVQAVEQVDRARADGAQADAEATGELGLGADRERGRLLVTYADPLDPVVLADRVGDGVERVADDAPELGDAVVGERGDDGGSDGSGGRGHRSSVGRRR
jgi:hypothetical protein